jgi:hypothetical protein
MKKEEYKLSKKYKSFKEQRGKEKKTKSKKIKIHARNSALEERVTQPKKIRISKICSNP